LLKANLVATGGEAKRMVAQAAVSINGHKVNDPFAEIKPEDGMIVQVGKRKFARLKVNS
jgi:tyrosyl-tRNA synthetase